MFSQNNDLETATKSVDVHACSLLKTTELIGQTKSNPANKSDLLDVTLACEGGQKLKAHKIKMAQGTIEEQVKTLQKLMGAILVTVRVNQSQCRCSEKEGYTKRKQGN